MNNAVGKLTNLLGLKIAFGAFAHSMALVTFCIIVFGGISRAGIANRALLALSLLCLSRVFGLQEVYGDIRSTVIQNI